MPISDADIRADICSRYRHLDGQIGNYSILPYWFWTADIGSSTPMSNTQPSSIIRLCPQYWMTLTSTPISTLISRRYPSDIHTDLWAISIWYPSDIQRYPTIFKRYLTISIIQHPSTASIIRQHPPDIICRPDMISGILIHHAVGGCRISEPSDAGYHLDIGRAKSN